MAAPPCRRAGARRCTRSSTSRRRPDWWSEELAAWADNQRRFGKDFKKHASERSPTEKKYAKNTTKRRVALLDGIGLFT